MHVHLNVFVWWVCNLSDTSWPRGRDTRELMDNNSAFTGQREQPGVTGWQQGSIHFTAACWLIKALCYRNSCHIWVYESDLFGLRTPQPDHKHRTQPYTTQLYFCAFPIQVRPLIPQLLSSLSAISSCSLLICCPSIISQCISQPINGGTLL